jgi:2,3-dihydroxyphenylpropionate 1,2-dioxygenase
MHENDPRSMVVCASHSPLIDTADGGAGGREFLGAVDRARAAIQDFAPELVVFFGPDHARALQNLVPAVTVVDSATGYGDWGTPTDPYVVPSDLAIELAQHLLVNDIDVAVGTGMALDHGFGQTFVQLFGELGAVSCLPILLNCARPPLSAVHRVADVGNAVGDFLRGTGRKVVFVGSGGLSHEPPSMNKELMAGLTEREREALARRTVADGAKHINPSWDRAFLQNLTSAGWDRLRGITDDELFAVGAGTHEIRTWVAAWSAAGPIVGTFTYAPVPEWITGMGVAVGA